MLVRNRQRNTKVSSVHTVTVPHTTMFLSYKGPIVGQSRVALDVNPVCKGLYVLNINARMLKQRSNQRPSPQNNKRKTIHTSPSCFQTFNIKQVPLISKTIQSTQSNWI